MADPARQARQYFDKAWSHSMKISAATDPELRETMINMVMGLQQLAESLAKPAPSAGWDSEKMGLTMQQARQLGVF